MQPENRSQHHDSRDRDSTLYCLVPPDRPELHELLNQYLDDVPGIEVIADRRGIERRGGEDRRQGNGAPPAGAERRRNARRSEGKRSDRRAAAVPVERPVPIPPQASGAAESVVFFERLEPTSSDDPEERLAQAEAVIAKWRERCLDSEREAEELVRALVDAGEGLRSVRKRSPRWLAAVRRAERMIERYRQRRITPHTG